MEFLWKNLYLHGEKKRISSATRYAAHLIETFAKKSMYEISDDFEREFLKIIFKLKDETTKLTSLIKWTLTNIDDNLGFSTLGNKYLIKEDIKLVMNLKMNFWNIPILNK